MNPTETGSTFQKGHPTNRPPIEYPLTAIPDYECDVVSPVVAPGGWEPRYKRPVIGPEEMFEAAAVAHAAWRSRTDPNVWFPVGYVNNYQLPEQMPAALRQAGMHTLSDLALAVHMDRPLDFYYILVDWLRAEGYKRRVDYSFGAFLEQDIAEMVEVALTIEAALKEAFTLKWYWGEARPEEVYGANLGPYPEGCPAHPSTPAGHATIFGAAAAVIARNWHLPNPVEEELMDTARCAGHGRTAAFVHWGPDNELGFLVGQDVAHETGYDTGPLA